VEEDSPLGEHLKGLTPTIRWIHKSMMGTIRQSEYDAAVVVGERPNLDMHLQIIQFGGKPSAYYSAGPGGRPWSLGVRSGDRAERFTVDRTSGELGIPEQVLRSLFPEPASGYEVLHWQNLGGPAGQPPINSFASEDGGRALAGWVQQRSSMPSGEIWWLPDRVIERAAEWVDIAFTRWQEIYPDSFPRVATWSQEDEWMTREEKAAASAVAAHVDESKRIAEVRAREADELSRRLEDARSSADEHERRLLTAKGDDLVGEVAACLGELGFTVRDADLLPQHQSAKQEDLRISYGSWECLAEVKGYSRRNAKVGDLLQLGKAVEAYLLTEHRRPDARWYIVNQAFALPPGQRRPPLEGADLTTFQSDGLAIDTRDLFRLREAVRNASLSADDARTLLMSSRGVLSYRG
jgi:hypothetical protein